MAKNEKILAAALVSAQKMYHLFGLAIFLSAAAVSDAAIGSTTTLNSSSSTKIHAVNECNFTIWPAWIPSPRYSQLSVRHNRSGEEITYSGGAELRPAEHMDMDVKSSWGGRIWARTGCNFTSGSLKPCQTGDCNGVFNCILSGDPPATLAQFSALGFHPDMDQHLTYNIYYVSIVDGFNLPIVVSASNGCPHVGCTKDVNSFCPKKYQVKDNGGNITACKSSCLAFGTDKECCTGDYVNKCKGTKTSTIFKKYCPSTYCEDADVATSKVSGGGLGSSICRAAATAHTSSSATLHLGQAQTGNSTSGLGSSGVSEVDAANTGYVQQGTFAKHESNVGRIMYKYCFVSCASLHGHILHFEENQSGFWKSI